MGGNLVSYNSGPEQLEVEKYFGGTGGRRPWRLLHNSMSEWAEEAWAPATARNAWA